jgi:hypothetical protein
MITVHSLERAQGMPVYPGHMEITEERDGLLPPWKYEASYE